MTAQTMAQVQVKEYRPDDPSYWRRKALLDELGGEGSSEGISVSSFFPIQRYYEAADKVLAAFEEAVGQGDLDASFVYGKRFCTFCLESIPKHNYYLSKQFEKERFKYMKDAQIVLSHLEKVKEDMNVEERAKHEKRLELARQEAARREAERKRQEAIIQQREKAKYQELVRRASEQRKTNTASTSPLNGVNVQQSAMSKLEMLMKQASATSVAASKDAPTPPPKRPSGRYFLSDTEEEEEGNINASIGSGQPLLPPLLPPSYDETGSLSLHSKSNGSLPPPLSPSAVVSPPPYDYAVNNQRRNPFLGPSNGVPFAVPPPVQPWGEMRPSSCSNSNLPDPPTKRYPTRPDQPPVTKKIPVRQLREKARRRYLELQDEGQIEVRPIDTYQGRNGNSTNGCTVISPLVVARHLATSNGVVLPDRDIKQVIDYDCVPLLQEIRGKLGLGSHSLIIPSDVHDHLTDKKILQQDYFVGATGGNILSEEHMGEFVKLFQEKRKAGAALFFREHVVSIVKIPVGSGGKAYYDLVDSMPGTTDARNNPCASRTRCKDDEALNVLLTWYATKKFSDSNCTYIDNNDWNDRMADLDPRVFQAFVWGKDE